MEGDWLVQVVEETVLRNFGRPFGGKSKDCKRW